MEDKYNSWGTPDVGLQMNMDDMSYGIFWERERERERGRGRFCRPFLYVMSNRIDTEEITD